MTIKEFEANGALYQGEVMWGEQTLLVGSYRRNHPTMHFPEAKTTEGVMSENGWLPTSMLEIPAGRFGSFEIIRRELRQWSGR